jgi:hypothetical protein
MRQQSLDGDGAINAAAGWRWDSWEFLDPREQPQGSETVPEFGTPCCALFKLSDD